LKQVTLISISIFLFGLFFFRDNNSNADTQVVLRINGMLNSQLQLNLENEFRNLSGVEYCNSSLSTKTIILNIDEESIGEKELQKTLDKWGCSIINLDFTKLY